MFGYASGYSVILNGEYHRSMEDMKKESIQGISTWEVKLTDGAIINLDGPPHIIDLGDCGFLCLKVVKECNGTRTDFIPVERIMMITNRQVNTN